MISALKTFTDRFLGRGEATITVPSFDGILTQRPVTAAAAGIKAFTQLPKVPR